MNSWTSEHQTAQALARQRTGRHISAMTAKNGVRLVVLSFDAKGRARQTDTTAEHATYAEALDILKAL